MLLFAKEEYANISKSKSQVFTLMVRSMLAGVQNTQQRYVSKKMLHQSIFSGSNNRLLAVGILCFTSYVFLVELKEMLNVKEKFTSELCHTCLLLFCPKPHVTFPMNKYLNSSFNRYIPFHLLFQNNLLLLLTQLIFNTNIYYIC